MALSIAGRFYGFLHTLLGQYHAGGSVHSAYPVHGFSYIGSVKMERKGGHPLPVFCGTDLWFECREPWNGGLLPSRHFDFVFVLVPAQPVETPLAMHPVFSFGFFNLHVFANPFLNGTDL